MKIIEKTTNLKKKKKWQAEPQVNNYIRQGGKIFFEIET